MNDSNNRNLIVFVVIAAAVMLAYQYLFIGPAEKQHAAALQAQQQAQQQASAVLSAGGATAAPTNLDITAARALSQRQPIQTSSLQGSLSLTGARIDDLNLSKYKQSLDANAPPIELLKPQGTSGAYFAAFGWVGQNVPNLPNASTAWTSTTPGQILSVGHPVGLHYDNGAGVAFDRTISIDDKYMFTVTDKVTNASATPLTLAAYASVQRQGLPVEPAGRRVGISFEGLTGGLGEQGKEAQPITRQFKYADMKKKGTQTFHSKGGWAGIDDKYWMAAVIPDQNEDITANFKVTTIGDVDIYEANYTTDAKTLNPGASLTHTQHLFAGAKEVPTLKMYEKTLAIPRFDYAVDWGWWFPITRPVFTLLDFFYHWVGNFGLAILMLTVVVKLVFFYPSNLSYANMSKMRKIQPEMAAIKERFKDDPAKQQQATMELYKSEKLNPLMGCLPALVTIPVFFSLFKVLNVTIEMYHAPFFGWVHDLSARDPLTILNLFGLIHWDPATAPLVGNIFDNWLHLGPWAILYGVTMFITQSMSPPSPDPTQQAMLRWMPVLFTALLSQYAVGLLIYYSWSNLLTIIQQYVIMRRYQIETPIDRLLARRKPAA